MINKNRMTLLFTSQKSDWALVEVTNTLGNMPIQTWPKSGYSRQKALARSDRRVGEIIRQSDYETQVSYTQEVPVV